MILGPLISWYFRQRINTLEDVLYRPLETQERMLQSLLEAGSYTEFGRRYDFAGIHNYEQFKRQVPLQDYESLKPFIERTMAGEQGLLWPGDIYWFAKSSGTTHDKSKFIPVSFESLEECHFKGGRDVLTFYCNAFPDSKIFEGKNLLIGGSHSVNQHNENSWYGDLSAVLMNHMPVWASFLKTPDLNIALMEHWEEKLEKMAAATINEHVTSISGVPTWTLVLFQRLLDMTGKNNIRDIWPDLELYIHGGVSFVPYYDQFASLIRGAGMHYLETYNASEGFFGIQDVPGSRDLLLMTDYGVFFEFIPTDRLDESNPPVYPLAEVQAGVNYAVVISTNSGLWRYQLGDTICFSSTSPYRFTISGRTKLFMNAFGEELMIDNADKAISAACTATDARVREYTAAPVYMSAEEPGHEWLIEFEQKPNDLQYFTEVLDQTLKACNSDYEAKRQKDLALRMPKVRMVPDGVFHAWMKQRGKLGGQHKVPRLSNDRRFVEEILGIFLPGQQKG
jgi:hypothetical protein